MRLFALIKYLEEQSGDLEDLEQAGLEHWEETRCS